MAFSLFNRSNKTINLEITDHSIRYAEMKPGKLPSIHKSGEFLLPAGIVRGGRIIDIETLKAILDQCVADWRINRRQVRFMVPDQFVVMKKIMIDQEVNEDEIEGYLYLQLGTSIHLPFEEPVFDTYILGEADGQKEVLLFAAAEEVILQYQQLLAQCKLTPVVADISSLAAYRLYHQLDLPQRGEHLLILQFGLYGVMISIFSDDTPLYLRHILIPADQEIWEREPLDEGNYRWVMNGDEEDYFQLMEDVYKEIERVVSFYKYNMNNSLNEVTRVVLFGDHPFMPRIEKNLKERFPMELNWLGDERLQALGDIEQVSSYYSVAGLGLRGGL
ncbi:type IV pilus biogenesis protein PilM [Bacillus testis]|uniref:type IV pilus biogenesis protein PilM n=1 Tax=Bacillus testis TaxID=1622072 RepID=UPI00067ECF3E|nr:pilus assembly protein PilM [Bacillus testis]